jgi:BirA family biotin operon repressor/biotin-[acetyl-CoA-carboxylase] ligase
MARNRASADSSGSSDGVRPEPLVKQCIDVLDAGALAAAVEGPLRGRVRRIEVFAELPSTNSYLLAAAQPAPALADACLAELQTAGRGRFGRSWHAPSGAGLCLSVAWRFAVAPRQLSALTLALGVVVRRVVADLTGAAIRLKWPNDLVHEDRKLGGILVEVAAEAPGGSRVVAGLGLNVAFPAESLAAVGDSENRATDLRSIAGNATPPRTELALELIAAFADVLGSYAITGFAPYRDEWRSADSLSGRPIRIQAPSGAWLGTAAGIDDDGALLVMTEDGACRRVASGEVSVRVRG